VLLVTFVGTGGLRAVLLKFAVPLFVAYQIKGFAILFLRFSAKKQI